MSPYSHQSSELLRGRQRWQQREIEKKARMGEQKDSPWTTDRENRRWKMKSLTLSSLAWLLWDTTLLLACRVKEETKDMKNNHFSRISFTFYAYMEGITALSAVQHQLCVSMRIENEFFFLWNSNEENIVHNLYVISNSVAFGCSGALRDNDVRLHIWICWGFMRSGLYYTI